MTVMYSFLVHTATTRRPAELMKASKPVPPGVKKLVSCFLLSPFPGGPSCSWSSDSQARKLKAGPGHRVTVGTTTPAMLGVRSKYCMAHSRPCRRTMASSARRPGPAYGWAPPAPGSVAAGGSRSRRRKASSSAAASERAPSAPSSVSRLSAAARCSRAWRSSVASSRTAMAALTQTARVRRFRQQRRRSQSAVYSCSSGESSSGSHWTSSSRGSTLLMPSRPTEPCAPSTACRGRRGTQHRTHRTSSGRTLAAGDLCITVVSALMVATASESNRPSNTCGKEHGPFIDHRASQATPSPGPGPAHSQRPIGHIQYMSTVVKDNRKQFRLRYGVQFLLDTIRLFYGKGSGGGGGGLSEDDVRTLCSLLELLIGLLQTSPARDQLVLLLFEPGAADSCYALLLHAKHSDRLRELVFKLFERMLRCDRVYERSKQRMRLRDAGYSGLSLLFPDGHLNPSLLRCLLTQGSGSGRGCSAHAAPDSVSNCSLDLGGGRCGARLDPPCVERRSRATSRDEDRLSVGDARSLDSLESGGGGVISLPDTPSSSSAARAGAGPARGLTLDLSHVQAYEGGREEGGSQTPASGPSTPSPLDGSKPFLLQGAAGGGGGDRDQATPSLSEDSFLFSDNISLGESFSGTERAEEELSGMLLDMLPWVTWRGVEGSDEGAWLERGQGAAGGVASVPRHTENAVRLLDVVQDVVQAEGPGSAALWGPGLLDGALRLMDCLLVWHADGGGAGGGLLLGYMGQEEPQVCAMATAKLNGVLQTKVVQSQDEACYLLGKVEGILRRALHPPDGGVATTDAYAFLVPLMRTLLAKVHRLLYMELHLPQLPDTSGGPTFFEDFQALQVLAGEQQVRVQLQQQAAVLLVGRLLNQQLHGHQHAHVHQARRQLGGEE
ncbi:hypothetical protein CRUP_002255 [Coryphaenoides rupestris]|nr:hypothetical protein CRUP_002255 [Coryphaenoides rupestris]